MDNQHKYLEIAARILADPDLDKKSRDRLILKLVGGLEYTLTRFKAKVIEYQSTIEEIMDPIEDMDPTFRDIDMN